VLGLLIAMVGIDPVRGAPRFTFGVPSLYDGVGFIPVVMGLFGIAEILITIERPYHDVIKTKLTSLLPSREEWRRSLGAIGRGTGIGFFLGLIPGVGAIIPTFVAYVVENNDVPNFAEAGTTVASVPVGTGMLILAADPHPEVRASAARGLCVAPPFPS